MDRTFAKKEEADKYPKVRLVTIWLGASFCFLDRVPGQSDVGQGRTTPSCPHRMSTKTSRSRNLKRTLSRYFTC